jgi:hypothetical protein
MAPWLTELPQQSTLTTEAAEDRWAQIREGGKEKKRKSSRKYSAKYSENFLESGVTYSSQAR